MAEGLRGTDKGIPFSGNISVKDLMHLLQKSEMGMDINQKLDLIGEEFGKNVKQSEISKEEKIKNVKETFNELNKDSEKKKESPDEKKESDDEK